MCLGGAQSLLLTLTFDSEGNLTCSWLGFSVCMDEKYWPPCGAKFSIKSVTKSKLFDTSQLGTFDEHWQLRWQRRRIQNSAKEDIKRRDTLKSILQLSSLSDLTRVKLDPKVPELHWHQPLHARDVEFCTTAPLDCWVSIYNGSVGKLAGKFDWSWHRFVPNKHQRTSQMWPLISHSTSQTRPSHY